MLCLKLRCHLVRKGDCLIKGFMKIKSFNRNLVWLSWASTGLYGHNHIMQCYLFIMNAWVSSQWPVGPIVGQWWKRTMLTWTTLMLTLSTHMGSAIAPVLYLLMSHHYIDSFTICEGMISYCQTHCECVAFLFFGRLYFRVLQEKPWEYVSK